MTKKDVIGLVAILVQAYPNFDKFKSDEQVELLVNMWAKLFADDDSRIVSLAVQKHIMVSKWPPSVAELREIMADITHPDLIPPDQAWAAVSDLLYAVGEYNHGSAEEQLPPLICKTVKAIGWHTLYELHCGSYRGNKDGMDRVAFMDLYKPAYARARQDACLPASLRQGIEATRAQLTDGGLKQIEAASARRIEKEHEWDAIYTGRITAALEARKVPAITAGESEDE